MKSVLLLVFIILFTTTILARCPIDEGCECSGAECCCRRSLLQLPDDVTHLTLVDFDEWRLRRRMMENCTRVNQLTINQWQLLETIDGDAFKEMVKLKKLTISNAPRLRHLEDPIDLTSTHIMKVVIEHTALEHIPNVTTSGRALKFPLHFVYHNNSIRSLTTNEMRNVFADVVEITGNRRFSEIQANAFRGASIGKLFLHSNPALTSLHSFAFDGITLDMDTLTPHLKELDLSRTSITTLPVAGLDGLQKLSIKDTPSLKRLPLRHDIPDLAAAQLHYPFHCCLYKDQRKNLTKKECSLRTRKLPTRQRRGDLLKMPPGFTYSRSENDTAEVDGEYLPPVIPGIATDMEPVCIEVPVTIDLYCTPAANPLNPCEDVMPGVLLRVAVWLVCTLAVAGNVGVIIVLVFIHDRIARMRVHYFFMLNLAFADLCIAIYLLLLAITDIRTAGEYANSAIDWQTGDGCTAAGLLAVFGSQLSIACMALISAEIWYNTKNALYGPFRMWWAVVAMIISWIVSFAFAIAPVMGVSDYSVTSTCLPLANDEVHDLVYLGVGLFINALSFVTITCAYVSIFYLVWFGAGSGRDVDLRVAKKMALLIGTDFACWAPTLFFGTTAAFGYPLISLTTSKIFLVLFFPINAFANPFLYVFFTRAVRQDMSRVWETHFAWRWHYIKTRQTVKTLICCHERHHSTLQTEDEINRYYAPTNAQVIAMDQCQSYPRNVDRNHDHSGNTQSTSVLSTPRGSDTQNEEKPYDGATLGAHDVAVRLLQRSQSTTTASRWSSSWFARMSEWLNGRPKFHPQMSDISEHSDGARTQSKCSVAKSQKEEML